MDDGTKQLTSLTLGEEDYFEAGDSTDGESEDLDELICKAENSQHLWLNFDNEELLTDVELLQKKLFQKDEGLNLTAKIGKKLLCNTDRLTSQNQELRTQVQDLREELTQLKYLQSSRGKSFQYFEGSDDDEVDEGTCCGNHNIVSSGNLNNISLSTSLEETFSMRRQIELLQLSNLTLRDELKALQQQALEEMDQLKEHYNQEFSNTKKLIGNLEKRMESGENRFLRFEYETKIWKESVEALAAKCNLHECEIDELQNEISKIKLDQKEEKKAMEQLVRENEELKEFVGDLKSRVHQMEQISQPKVLRHVTDSSSPYVDSKSFTQELEQSQLDQNRENRMLKYTRQISPHPPLTNHFAYHPENFFARLRDFFVRSATLKLGQPGRPGSTDLELAVAGLTLKQPITTSKSDSVSWLRYQIQSFETLLVGGLFTNSEVQGCCTCHSVPSSSSSSLSSNKKKIDKQCITCLPCSLFQTPDSALAIRSNYSPSTSTSLQPSRFLQNWFNLGTPDLTTIFRKQSGVWIKGTTASDMFIEENFANIGLEAEEDECEFNRKASQPSSCTHSIQSLSITSVLEMDENEHIMTKSKLYLRNKTNDLVDTHQSLNDITKCSYNKILSTQKSISLSDMSKQVRHSSSLGLNSLWSKSIRNPEKDDFDDEFVSSMKIIRTTSRNS